MYRTLLCAFVVCFLAICPCSSASADTPTVVVQLESAFAKVEKLVDGEKFGDAGDALSDLRGIAVGLGYQDLPDYSERLLDRAALLSESNRNTEASYLIRQAVALSPQDPRILFRASSFESALGHSTALSYFVDGMTLSLGRPMMVASFARNSVLAALMAGTLALLLVAVIQLVCNVRRVIINATRKASIYTRGLLGPLMFLVFMVLPLAGGLLVAIGCWCLVLSRFIKECRSLALIAGCAILGWALAIPSLQAVTLQLASELSGAVERSRFGAFSPADLALLSKESLSYGHDPIVRFSLGSALFRAGDLAGAEREWRAVSEVTEASGSQEVASVARLNRGVISFQNGDFIGAKSLFERAEEIGGKTFESSYNLSRVALAQLDTLAHDEQFEHARALDSQRLSALESSSADLNASLLSVQPRWSLYALRLLKPVAGADGSNAGAVEGKRSALVSTLIAGAHSTSVIFLLGFTVIAAAFWSRNKGARDFYRYRDGALEHSRIWAIVPAGPFIVGNRPICWKTIPPVPD